MFLKKSCFTAAFLAAVLVHGESLPFETLSVKCKNLSEAQKIFAETDEPVVRRAVFRILVNNPVTRGKSIQAGLSDNDPLLRVYSLNQYFAEHGDGAIPQLQKMVKDTDLEVVKAVLQYTKILKDKKQSLLLFQKIAETSVFPEIQAEVKKQLDFPFYRETMRLKDNPTYDHEVLAIRSIPLPLEGWNFAVDPKENGHKQGFFKVDYNDSQWKKMKIGVWEEQGFPRYDGIAWYRIKFRMPGKIDSNAVELAFQAVDESAWVWLNGIYVGQHDIGPSGWDQAFWLDISREILWGKENLLVVRVLDTEHAGGIWKPVSIEILK